MAKTTMGVGQFSGKVGGLVYAVSGGQQIVRQYQPIVVNPKSKAQSLQRAKGNLVGKLSHMVDSSLLIGMMGSNKRGRRSEWLSKLLKATSAVESNGIYTASIKGDAVVWSQGLSLNLATMDNSGLAVDSNNLLVMWKNGIDSAAYPSAKGLVVALIYDKSFAQLNPSLNAWRLLTTEVTMSARQAELSLLGVSDSGNAIEVYAWVCPYVINNELGEPNGLAPVTMNGELQADFTYFDSDAVAYVDSAFLGWADLMA